MTKIYRSATELVGNTPLLELVNIEKAENLNAKILAKLEYFNTTGSCKDRIAVNMIEDAEKRGLLKKGDAIIEPTSGNTGIGLASVGVGKGYRVIIVMPETMSVERRNLIRAYGAEIVLTDGSRGMSGAIEKAKELEKSLGGVVLSQFDNLSNAEAHYKTTGPEIYRDTEGSVDILVAGVGTGGTITGTAKYLKEKNPTLKAVAVEPSSSPVLSKGVSGRHGIQGIGAGFVPKVLDLNVVDEIIAVDDLDAINMAKKVASTEGVLVGISSGAALVGAIEEAKKEENKGKTIVVVFPDSGDRYMSTALFDFD